MTKFARRNDDPRQEPIGSITEEEVLALPAQNPNDLFILVPWGAENKFKAMEEVENTHYTPDTDRNKLFELIIYKWPVELNLPWGIFVVPMSDKHLVSQVLAKNGFQLNFDYTSIIFDNGKPSEMPFKGPNVSYISPLEH